MLFNTSDPYNWKLKKRIAAQDVYWTVSDMDVCQNEQYLIYSTLNPIVHLIDLDTLSSTKSQIINFGHGPDNPYGGGAIMSLKFSGDTKEIVGATKSADILVFDLLQNRISSRISEAHDDEINSVCFANREHSQLIFTGSDDSLVKVWDRRALVKEAGCFIGHSEGVTHVTSKGDGIMLASNCKDQLLKVWDIRKMTQPEKMSQIRLPRKSGFDYRYMAYPFVNRQIVKHPSDQSLFTFKGHQVLKTLIRCYFSPLETTGQRYIYTGSKDGKLRVYDLYTGDEAMVLSSKRANSVARDVSWHPTYPVIASTSFEGEINTWTLQNNAEPEPI